MVAQDTPVLISYNDNNKDPLERDKALAMQLANYLRGNGISVEVKGYSTSTLNTDDYQWLILIPSLEIEKSPQMTKLVDTALEQVIKRHMKGVLAVTASTSDLPSKWATIRKYDASDPRETNIALEGVLRAMRYAKVTYPEAKDLVQSQQEQQAAALAASRRQKALRIWLRPVLIIAILILLVGGGGFAWFTIHPSRSVSTLSPTNLTATAQARTHATQTALGKTPQTSPTVVATATLQAEQQEYNNITKKLPKITGFQASEQWSTPTDKTCAFDKNNPAAYHASIQVFGQYMRCMAANTKFTNFALQVTMTIQGDAGGVIFRDNGNGTYYRFAFNQSDASTTTSDTYSVYLCNGDCNLSTVGAGTQIAFDTIKVDRSKPITLTIIALNSNIDLYFNKTFLTRVTATTSLSGEIGVFAASVGNPTDVTFSNLKVWSLDKTK